MIRLAPIAALGLLALTACNQNTDPGNDREAQLEPAPTPAPKMGAAEALSGVATGAIQPETMSDADIASLGGMSGKCSLRLTAVGFPSFVYDDPQGTGVIKLNGKLIPLASRGQGKFADGGLRVELRPVDQEFGDDGRREAEMIIWLPEAKDELGFRGYEVCPQKR
ncbi:DUF6692 family protein [Erythrobacter sp. 3-20A1M]|uniref:DUF6692 family protein n=1 Tax=Erythrobacter sp. 3-20A1M TaxID=2653850 RepID=UPI00203B6023|nr:DUF6692 family protein [Erythrobacter sp. 3-20A1M]